MMKHTRREFLVLSLVASLAACLAIAGPESTLPRLDYRVRVTGLADQSLHVTLTIQNPSERTAVLRTVPMYMDNPVAKPDHSGVENLKVTDQTTGRAISLSAKKDRFGERIYAFQSKDGAVKIEYDARIRYRESAQTRQYPIRIPYMDRDRAWLYGNYVFCYPEWVQPKVDAATARMDITVSFEVPETVQLVGVPPQCSLANIYQLMSLQFALGPFETVRATSSGVDLAVAFERPADFTAAEKESLKRALVDCVSTVVRFFGATPLESFTLFVFRDQGIGGMEGTFSCQVYAPKDLDLSDDSESRTRLFKAVTMHEVFHTWNPIFLFAVDDPWIKEGITGYYGEVLSARAGILKERDLDGAFSYYYRQLDQNPLLKQIPLTDPRIWANEYEDEQWRTLSYDRGKVVALLLDLKIREATSNSKSLDDVMRLAYARYGKGRFTHEDLVALVREVSSQPFDRFFQDYVRGRKLAGRHEVEMAVKRVQELGAFAGETVQAEIATSGR